MNILHLTDHVLTKHYGAAACSSALYYGGPIFKSQAWCYYSEVSVPSPQCLQGCDGAVPQIRAHSLPFLSLPIHYSLLYNTIQCYTVWGTYKQTKTNSVALSPRANYTDWATATCRRNLVPTSVDRGVSRGQRGGSPTAVNLSFLERRGYFSFKQLLIYPHTADWTPFRTHCYSENLVAPGIEPGTYRFRSWRKQHWTVAETQGSDRRVWGITKEIHGTQYNIFPEICAAVFMMFQERDARLQ
jgi:hypothetical protein